MSKKPGPKKGTKHDQRPRSEFASRLITVRKKKGLSQVQLAEKMGVNQGFISHYEGDSEGPTPELLKRFAVALGVSVKVLLGDVQIESGGPPPPKAIQKRLDMISRLPQKDQQTIARIIDGLASQHGIAAPK